MSEGKILIWGEFPPNTHTGISVSNELISNILKTENIQVIRVEENTWNNNALKKIKNLFKNYFQIIRFVLSDKIKILYFNLPLSGIGLLKIMLILPWIKLFSYRTILKGHLHRGDFNRFINRGIVNRGFLSTIFFLINELVVLSLVYQKEVNRFYKKIKIYVLHNTSDFESTINSYHNKYNGNYLCLSNYIKYKGLMELIECFNSQELSEIKLTIYGNLYEIPFFDDLKEGASNNIALNKGLNRGEVLKVLKNYDCLIIPSWNEGQPIVILEAMSLGIPIIATDVGDVSNMLGENYDFIVNPQDSNSLLKAIVKFNETEKKEEISNYLFKRYNACYSNYKHKRKVLEIFEI